MAMEALTRAELANEDHAGIRAMVAMRILLLLGWGGRRGGDSCATALISERRLSLKLSIQVLKN